MNDKFERIGQIQSGFADEFSDSQRTDMKRGAIYNEPDTTNAIYSKSASGKSNTMSSLGTGSIRSTVIKRKISSQEEEQDLKFEEYLLHGQGRKYAQSVYKQRKK